MEILTGFILGGVAFALVGHFAEKYNWLGVNDNGDS